MYYLIELLHGGLQLDEQQWKMLRLIAAQELDPGIAWQAGIALQYHPSPNHIVGFLVDLATSQTRLYRDYRRDKITHANAPLVFPPGLDVDRARPFAPVATAVADLAESSTPNLFSNHGFVQANHAIGGDIAGSFSRAAEGLVRVRPRVERGTPEWARAAAYNWDLVEKEVAHLLSHKLVMAKTIEDVKQTIRRTQLVELADLYETRLYAGHDNLVRVAQAAKDSLRCLKAA
jgi:hypothetical protein